MNTLAERAKTQATLTTAGAWLCVAGAALGATGLLGWATGIPFLTTVVSGLPHMMPNTAMATLLIGAAAALRKDAHPGIIRSTLAVLATFLVLAIGVGTLIEYAMPTDARFDHVLGLTASPTPTRPAMPTGLSLTLLAVALLLRDIGPATRVSASELLTLGGALPAFAGLTGIILDAPLLYSSPQAQGIGVSLPTAISLLLTSLGMLLLRPADGITRVATSQGPGGILVRRLGPLAVTLPVLLGLVVTRVATVRNIEDVAVPVAILAAAVAALDLFLLGATAPLLNRAHEHLEASRTQTRNLVEHAPDGIFLADIDGRYTDVNAAGRRMLGYAREDIIGKTIVDLIPAEDSERLRQAREVLLQGGIQVAEWQLRRSDGSYVPVEVSTKILSDGRWQAFVRDISDRKRLEAELRFAEARASGILSISADAIISIDDRQSITQFNEGAEHIFGYTKGEVIGGSLDVLLPPGVRPVHHSHVERFAAGSEVARRMGAHGGAIVGRRKSGEEFPADAAISRLEVGGTRVLTVIVRDVTEQKRVENEQRFLADLGSALVTTLDYKETASHLAAVAAKGLSDFCIVDLMDEDGVLRSRQAVSRDPSSTAVCEVLQHAPPGANAAPAIQSALATRQPVVVAHPSFQHVAALADGADQIDALRGVELRALIVLPLVAHGQLLGAISFLFATPGPAEDERNLRMAEEIARREALALDNARLYRAAQRAISARDEVLGIVAHDLRNPLSVILMQAHLLRRDDPEIERRSQSTGGAIERAAMRMDRLIQDLLDATRIDAHGLTIEPRPVNVPEVTAEAVRVQEAVASSLSLALRVEVEPGLPDIWADHDRLLQVFENLIGNAMKFTPPGGSITVGARRHGRHVRFSVADTGPGIAVADQPHVFDRFWQGQTKKPSGAGLGLPIVKGIVEAHSGRAWVEGAPGQGSTFRFTIPTVEHVEQAQAS